MAYGDVKEKFGKGILNKYWDYILSAATECGEDSDAAKDVLKLRNSLVKYARCEPWPPSNIDCYSPDCFTMKFFPREYADFNFYLGAGMALGDNIEKVHDDIEAEIMKACLASLEKHNEEKRIFLIESKNSVVDYLSSHIGETPTQKEMAEQTGINLTRLRAILAELKDGAVRAGRVPPAADALHPTPPARCHPTEEQLRPPPPWTHR